MDELRRIDPIDEHEFKILCLAIEVAEMIIKTIPYRKFSIKIIEE